MPTAVVLLSPERPGAGGIGDFTSHLLPALLARGWDASLQHDLSPPRRASSTIVLNYQPYMYGWQGLSPRLVYGCRSWRGSGHHVVLLAHELWSEGTTPAQRLREVLQRRQVADIARHSRTILASCQRWAVDLGTVTHRPVGVLPVGSNIPVLAAPDSATRRATRQRLGVPDDALVTLEFGRSHDSKGHDATDGALLALLQTASSVVHLLVGTATRVVALEHPRLVVRDLGSLPEAEVSLVFQAADLLLAPFVDGISARRTSAISAIAHGLPVSTNVEEASDPCFVGLGSAGTTSFSSWTAGLADPVARQRLAAAQTRLFDEYFDWERITDRLLAAIDQP